MSQCFKKHEKQTDADCKLSDPTPTFFEEFWREKLGNPAAAAAKKQIY